MLPDPYPRMPEGSARFPDNLERGGPDSSLRVTNDYRSGGQPRNDIGPATPYGMRRAIVAKHETMAASTCWPLPVLWDDSMLLLRLDIPFRLLPCRKLGRRERNLLVRDAAEQVGNAVQAGTLFVV